MPKVKLTPQQIVFARLISAASKELRAAEKDHKESRKKLRIAREELMAVRARLAEINELEAALDSAAPTGEEKGCNDLDAS